MSVEGMEALWDTIHGCEIMPFEHRAQSEAIRGAMSYALAAVNAFHRLDPALNPEQPFNGQAPTPIACPLYVGCMIKTEGRPNDQLTTS